MMPLICNGNVAAKAFLRRGSNTLEMNHFSEIAFRVSMADVLKLPAMRQFVGKEVIEDVRFGLMHSISCFQHKG